MSDPAGRPPRIVAELGRPETPEETAARKAESSRRHRSNQTLLNLVVALVACLAIVLFLVLVVVRPTQPPPPAVDYRAQAAEAQASVDAPLVAPVLPKSWSANNAELDTGSDDIVSWTIGLITPNNQFIAVVQGIEANTTWTSDQLGRAQSTGTEAIDGVTWKEYDQRDADDPGNFAYSMTTQLDGSSIVLHGTASTKDFRTLAAAIQHQLSEEDE